MGKVIFNMSVSLDGFVAGPNDGHGNGLGDGGEGLHEWYLSGTVPVGQHLKVSPQSAAVLTEAMASSGAGVWGRRTFDISDGWFGQPPIQPAFIVTHAIPAEWSQEGSPFTFVTDGVARAIQLAKAAAGDKNVVVCSASILQQALKVGLIDELHIDLVPILVGDGVRLFDKLGALPTRLERLSVVDAPGVTHLGFRVVK